MASENPTPPESENESLPTPSTQPPVDQPTPSSVSKAYLVVGLVLLIIPILLALITSKYKSSDSELAPTPTPAQNSESDNVTPEPMPTSEASQAAQVATPTPSAIDITQTPTTIATATPAAPRTITVTGFAYEDRNNDGSFNSNDAKLQFMQFYLYDSKNPDFQLSTIYSEENGQFTAQLNVTGNLIIKPTGYNNFTPKSPTQTYSSSTNNVSFGFRSNSAPVAGNNGLIEGDTFHDQNRNGTRDNGESGTFFYTLYLKDSDNNYYYTDQNTQTSDQGGHFKFQNLPTNKTYQLILSTDPSLYEVNTTTYTYTLTPSEHQKTNLQIPVFKN